MGVMVNLREFANLPEATVLRWRGFRHAVEVTDDFGEKLKTDSYSMLLTWQGMMLHRAFNDLPYSVKEIVPSGKGVVYNDNTLAVPMNYCLGEVGPTIQDPVIWDRIKMTIHKWQTKLNNLIVVMSEQSIISALAESVDDLIEDAGIMDIHEKVLNKEITIDEGEELFSDYLKTAESLDFNTVALLARTGGVSINQAYQTAIIRGAVFDLDNTIMPNAVMSRYADGVTILADSIGDNRGAGKSLNSNGRALKDSEWFHRKIHLFTAVLHSIDHMMDCGSLETVPIKIDSTEMAKGLLGKYRKLDDGGLQLIDAKSLKEIKAGMTVNMRSVAFCNNNKSGKPCGVCYGMMKSAIPYNVMMRKDANVGMYAGTTICNPLGQKMLSTKHFIRNAVSKKFVPHSRDKDIISSNGDAIFLSQDLCKEGTRLILKAAIVKDLSDLRSLDVLDEIALSKLPYFGEVTFQYEVEDIMVGGTTTQQHPAQTSVSSRRARFSMGFLQYILEKSWTAIDKKFISVDLSQWNHADPMFVLPYVREDLDAHRARVENFLTFNKRNAAWKKQVVTPKIFGEVLMEFWSLIDQETKGINVIHVETILACALTKDPNQNSYKLATGIGEKYFSSFVTCIDNRGSGTMSIFERQQNIMNLPKTFAVKDRQPSVLECFLQHAVA